MKYIISWVLRFIPRKFIQLFAHRLIKIYSIFLTGNKVYCPVCDHSFRHFLPYGRLTPRENALCPSCLSLERHRLMYLYLKNETSFFTEKPKLLHIAPEYCFIERFEKHLGDQYITADIESPLAKVNRWRLFLSEFEFSLQIIPGKANIIADMLSRYYHYRS